MAGVYKLEDVLTGEIYYIGSSVRLSTRETEHRDPQFPHHGPFGRWAHANGKWPAIRLVVLESLQHEDREQLKKLCRRREFQWKQQVPSTFGHKGDGLCEQPEDVRVAYRKKQLKEWRQKPDVRVRQRELARLYNAKKRAAMTDAQRQERNRKKREAHRKKRLEKDGVVIVRKPRGLTKDQRLARKRERYAEKQAAKGRVIKPRGRVHKPLRGPMPRDANGRLLAGRWQ